MVPAGAPPMLLTSLPKPGRNTFQVAPVVASGPQSATNSMTLPTMSWAPTSERHLLRAPVATADAPLTLHCSAGSSCGQGSGVPNAAACHSALLGRRLPELRHAAAAMK